MGAKVEKRCVFGIVAGAFVERSFGIDIKNSECAKNDLEVEAQCATLPFLL